MCGDVVNWSAEPDGGWIAPTGKSKSRREESEKRAARMAADQGLQVMFYNPICTLSQVEGAVLWASIAVAGEQGEVVVACEEGGGERGGSGGEVGVDEVGLVS